MKVDFKGVAVEELSFNVNRVRINPNENIQLKPVFSREVRKAEANPAVRVVVFSIKIETTEENPSPYNIMVKVAGIYDVTEIENEMQERDFIIEATKQLFPYARAALSNLTAQAYVRPINLPPISGPIFPEDRDQFAFIS